MLRHDVGVSLLHSTARRVGQTPVPRCISLLKWSPVSFPIFIWTLLAEIFSPPFLTCLRAKPAYTGMFPEDRPSCTARTTSYHVHLMCIPLFPARKTVLYCHPTSVFPKYPYSRVWPDDSSIFLCKHGVLMRSPNVYTSISCMQNRAILLTDVRIFKIYHTKLWENLNYFR